MKKHLLLICLALFTFQYQSQTGLTNMSFENWSNTFVGPSPTGWFGIGTTKMTSGAQQGNNFTRISSNSNSQGVLMLGVMTSMTGTFTGGAPYAQLPMSISGFYKGSNLTTNSNSAMLDSYTKHNGQVNLVASLTFIKDTSVWTSFSTQFFPINGNPTGVDSIFIVFNSGNFGSTAVLDVDNISIQSPTVVGVDEKSVGTSFLVYPNPVQNEWNVISKNEKAVSLILTGLDGKTIRSETLNEGDNKINLENITTGIYVYQVIDEDHNVLLRSKITIQK